MALAESLNSPVCLRIRAQTSDAIRPNMRRVKTWEARPAMMTLFPVEALEPSAARMAPILWKSCVSIWSSVWTWNSGWGVGELGGVVYV